MDQEQMPQPHEIGKRMAAARTLTGVSLENMARFTHKETKQLVAYEAGEAPAPIDLIHQYGYITDIDPQIILGLDVQRKYRAYLFGETSRWPSKT